VAVEASPALLGGRGELEAHGQRGLVRKSEPDSGADGGRRPLIKAVDRHRFVGRSNASGTTVVSMPASIIFSMIAIGCPRTLSKMRPIYSLRIPSKRLLCGAFVLGSFLSIVMTGTVYGHYFVQLVPGLSMFAAATFIPRGKALASWKADGAKFAFGIALIALTIFRTAAAEWSTLSQRLWAGEPLSYGTAYDIANFISSQGDEDYSLFMVNTQLVYWLLGRYPPTLLATHPSALRKPFIRKYLEPDSETTEDALRSVFLRQPTFVVWRPNQWLNGAAARFLEQELMTAYVLVGHIGSTQVFRRTAHVGASAPE